MCWPMRVDVLRGFAVWEDKAPTEVLKIIMDLLFMVLSIVDVYSMAFEAAMLNVSLDGWVSPL